MASIRALEGLSGLDKEYQVYAEYGAKSHELSFTATTVAIAIVLAS
jgi:hypothetical protein